MAGIEYVKDTGFSVDDNGKVTWQRKMMLFGENLMDILNGVKLPQYGSRHPNNSKLRLNSSTCNEVGNLHGKCQALWEGTYISTGELGYSQASGSEDDKAKSPWDLGAQNFTSTPFNIQEALTEHWNEDGEEVLHPPKNTAGNVLEVNHDVYGTEYSFIFCKKSKYSLPPALQQPTLNSDLITVAGVDLEPYEGLLMPMQYRQIDDEDEEGNARSYYEISVTIRIRPGGWTRRVLNVGTLAKPRDLETGAATSEIAEPVYRFTPWESKDADVKLRTKPKFGTLDQVIAAKNKYANIVIPDGVRTPEYWNAWQELPYQEMTEPLPLDDSGVLDIKAMTDPRNNPYKKVVFREYAAANWRQYNLPKSREK